MSPVSSNTDRMRVDFSIPEQQLRLVAAGMPVTVSTEVDGTLVNSYTIPGSEEGGEDVLTYAAQSLAVGARASVAGSGAAVAENCRLSRL
mgnify:CR=1 FL=1